MGGFLRLLIQKELDRAEMIARRGYDAEIKGLGSGDTPTGMEEAILSGADSWLTHSNEGQSLKERNETAFKRLVKETFLSGKDVSVCVCVCV